MSTAPTQTTNEKRRRRYSAVNVKWQQLRRDLSDRSERREALLEFAAAELQLPPLGCGSAVGAPRPLEAGPKGVLRQACRIRNAVILMPARTSGALIMRSRSRIGPSVPTVTSPSYRTAFAPIAVTIGGGPRSR